MYVASVPNRNSPPAILLRESFRLHGRVKNRTLANLSRWPPEKVQALRRLLKGETTLGPDLPRAFTITRSLPHGHVAAVLATIGRLGLRRLLSPRRCRERELVLAMITQRLLEPASKLATARALDPQTSHSSLGQQLELGTVRESDLYAALDWLLPQQPRLEAALAKRHLRQGALVLYDLTSTYFGGRKCPLAQYGYSRDERRGNPQIVLGLVSNDEGCPVAVEVFEGNTADPKTVAAQVERLRERFGLQRLVLVGDRGLLTTKRIEEDLRGREGVQWITALRAPQIRQLAADGVLQMSLFDERDLAELQHADYPGERLVVCRNPLLARRPLTDREKISYRLGRVLARSKVAKYFRWQIGEDGFAYERDEAAIEQDAALDGIYVIRTSLPSEQASAAEAVRTYKRLARVERAFRSLKSVDLHLRPIHHRLADRVRAHVLVCLLAYYVEWHLRQRLRPLLFDDEQPGEERPSPVAPAERSAGAQAKARRKRTPDGLPVQSFQSWLGELATITKNRLEPKTQGLAAFEMITRPTEPQRRALDLLGVKL